MVANFHVLGARGEISSRTVQLGRYSSSENWTSSSPILLATTSSLRTDPTKFIRWSLRWTLFSSIYTVYQLIILLNTLIFKVQLYSKILEHSIMQM